MPKVEKNTEPDNEQNDTSMLVGFARKSNACYSFINYTKREHYTIKSL